MAIRASSGGASEGERPLSLYGQVISTSVGFVKVELHHPDTIVGPEGTLLFRPQPSQTSTPSNPTPAEDSQPGPSGRAADEGQGQAESPGISQAGGQGQRPWLLPHRQLLCNVRSLLRKLSKKVLVGDHVQVSSIDWTHGRGSVQDVLPRFSELVDPAIANVDHALLVFALDRPPFEELQVTKFLVSMEASGLPFTLVLNKVDLVSEEERQRRAEQVRSWGYEPVMVSCSTGVGLLEAAQALVGRTSVVAGPSGAGKSSLINALRLGRHRPDQEPILGLQQQQQQLRLPPEEVLLGAGSGSLEQSAGSSDVVDEEGPGEQAPATTGSGSAGQPQRAATSEFLVVGEMSRVGRGMHTTTTVTLIKLQGGGMLADTPGFSQPGLSQISSQELSSLFPEIRDVVEKQPCRFNNCIHLMEPGCSVNNDSMAMERYPMYVKLLMEIKAREDTDVKLLQQAKQQREGSGKVKTGKGGKQRVEAKLDARKHRGGSRQQARLGVLSDYDD